MSNQSSDDQWLEVLAGRAQATDASTRQAAMAREFHVKLADADLAAPRDAQRLKRMLNAMEAQAAQERAAAPALTPAKSVGPLQLVMGWLFPVGSGGLRYAGVAAAVLGLAMALFVGSNRSPEDDGHGTMKSSPPTASSGAKAPAIGAPLLVLGGQPLERAAAVQAALKALGIEPQVVMGAQVRLTADIPATKQLAVKQALDKLQIDWVASDHMNLIFQAAP